MKTNSEYFESIVQRKECLTETTNQIKRYGFLWLKVSVTKTIKNTYFLLCKIAGTDFLLKVEVDEKTYNLSREGNTVSIHLSFTFDYACYHCLEEYKKEKIITIEKEK